MSTLVCEGRHTEASLVLTILRRLEPSSAERLAYLSHVNRTTEEGGLVELGDRTLSLFFGRVLDDAASTRAPLGCEHDLREDDLSDCTPMRQLSSSVFAVFAPGVSNRVSCA